MAPTEFVLKQANVLDESGGFSEPLDVHVKDGRVATVGPEISAHGPAIDFSGLWLMPGMFDCHDHISMTTFDALVSMHKPVSYWALESADHARRTIEGGVTSVRDAGGADAGLRDGIAAGFATGPRTQISVMVICQTGGHADGWLIGPGLEMMAEYLTPEYPGRPPFLADGVDEMRKVVRSMIRAGADWIKLCATGGIASKDGGPTSPQLTYDEIEVAVFEATQRGLGVLVHAYGGEGLTNSVRAGVRSIEHGGLLTEEQAAEMADAGCWLVPTLAAMKDCLRWANEGKMPEYSAQKARETVPKMADCVNIARAAGVKIALGTDYITGEQHGGNLEEIALAVGAGMPAGEALLAATLRGAELCGVDDELGRIARGYLFDAVVLDRDPSDGTLFAEPNIVTAVFKGGDPVVRHARMPA